jgi:hypothetical protein
MSESGQEIELRDKIDTYTIDLNKPSEFNKDEFIEKINSFHNPAAKWLVLGEKLIFFPFFTQHEKFFKSIQKESEYELKSAGIFMKSQDDGDNQMFLFSFSSSLSNANLLSKNESDEYKNGPLKEALAKIDTSFRIGD